MGLVKISDLPSAAVLTGAELIELSQGGFSRKGTSSLFAVLNLANVFTVFQTIRSAGGVNLRIENTGASINSYFGVDGSAGYAGTSSNHAFNLYTNNALRMAIGAAGNITIAAPSSGTALTVTSASGAYASTLSSGGSALSAGYNIGLLSNAWNLHTTGTDPFVFGTISAATAALYTNSAQRILVGSAGNVTINAPSSGVALTVNGSTQVDTGAIIWTIAEDGSGAYLDLSGSNNFRIYTGSAERIRVGNTGIVTINAPSSDTALILPAAATGYSSMRLPHGAAPSAPVNGDMWTTTAGLFVRINGATVGPLT